MRVEEAVDRVVALFIGTKHERDIKRLSPKVGAIGALAPEYEALSDAGILEKSAQLKAEVQERAWAAADPADDDFKDRLERRRWSQR